jgi:hypothetical protein
MTKRGTKPDDDAAQGGAPSEEGGDAADDFARDVLTRGEAAEPDAEGKLPPDATHAITGKKEDGTPEIKRARFKTF